MSRTVEVEKHEAVVDRDWLESIGRILLRDGHKELGEECIDLGNYKDEEEDEDEE
jgi:hypothetical protein